MVTWDHIFNEMKLDKTDKCLIVDDDRCMNLLNTIFKIYNTNSGVIVINIGFNCYCSDWIIINIRDFWNILIKIFLVNFHS